jgi:hypothetical protein
VEIKSHFNLIFIIAIVNMLLCSKFYVPNVYKIILTIRFPPLINKRKKLK